MIYCIVGDDETTYVDATNVKALLEFQEYMEKAAPGRYRVYIVTSPLPTRWGTIQKHPDGIVSQWVGLTTMTSL
jgi:hypothetical protein